MDLEVPSTRHATTVSDEGRSWISNSWYVAASSQELGDKPLARRICNETMVFYRAGGGRLAALEDFCPHRGAPLSLGFVREGRLVCGYHGLALSCDGRPAAMPGQDVSRFQPVRTYPVVERDGFVWVWPGDPALAKVEDPPRLAWAEDPAWAYGGGLFNVGCDYRLMIDNLMDLTHENYVHASSIGQPEIDEAPVDTVLEGAEVVTRRFMQGVQAPPFWRTNLQLCGLPEDAVVDRWQICRFSLPSYVMIEVGVALTGEGGHAAPCSKKVSSIVVDIMTPETETSHWYFWGMARNFAVDSEEVTAKIREGQEFIFSQDIELLQLQQRNLCRHPDRRLMTLNIDAGGAHSRRLIARALMLEHGAAA